MAALDRQQRSRLLTVTRAGFAGADRINAELAPPRRGRRRRCAAPVGGARASSPGTPVMITRNDYDRGLFNGDQGVVLSVVRRGTAAVARRRVRAWRRRWSRFRCRRCTSALSVAYASTVHKAQGSELDHAALMLPDADLPLLSRELVYTAVTRVRRSITVVGRRELLEQAVARPLERASGLGERIQARRTKQT